MSPDCLYLVNFTNILFLYFIQEYFMLMCLLNCFKIDRYSGAHLPVFYSFDLEFSRLMLWKAKSFETKVSCVIIFFFLLLF